MNLNTNARFAQVPEVNIKRSTVDMSFKHLTTANAGKLVPCFCKEVLPGDTWSVDTSILARMQTPVAPLMDDLYLDYWVFFVPYRILWSNFQRFMGESDQPWFDETEYRVPTIRVNVGDRSDNMCVKLRSVADHLGMPLAPTTPGQTEINPIVKEFNHLPFRAYCRVWNDWFREQSTMPLTAFNTEDDTVTMDNTGSAFYGGELLPVAKYRDYFTACLPQPQKGPDVTIGIGDFAPVYTSLVDHTREAMKQGGNSIPILHFTHAADGNDPYFTDGSYQIYGTYRDADTLNARQKKDDSLTGNAGVSVSNLIADISSISGISINQLRIAFATQQFYERLANQGSRYVEIIESLFGVTSSDARLDRSELLGGNRIALNISQVTQQSATYNQQTPLGNVGAYSLTTDRQNSFDRSFTEHGLLLGCFAIRYKHTYQNGYERMWNRLDLIQWYNPIYANIGNQPVYNREIYCDGSNLDEQVFGYQEAWADYRTSLNQCTGEMRSAHRDTLDVWHLGDDYTSRPYLSAEWQKENGSTVNRVLAVSDSVADQFLIDFYFSATATRPMPVYSIPGLEKL